MLLHSSIILLLFASTLLASVQLTPVSLFVDPCAGAAKLVNDDPAIKTDPGKASLQLSRATAVVASLEAKYNVKKSLHDAKLKNFNYAIDTLDKTEKERSSASEAVKITEELTSHYQDEYIEASAQARNPTLPFKSRKVVTRTYCCCRRPSCRKSFRPTTEYQDEIITDYNRALIKAAQVKAEWHKKLMRAKVDQASKEAAFNLKGSLFKLAESNKKSAKEAFQMAKLDIESLENELNEAKSMREGAKFLYNAAVQHTKKGPKTSLDVSNDECMPKYQRYG